MCKELEAKPHKYANFVSLQGIFEGLKAYKTEDGRILLFRPDENGLRMKRGADRMCMPSPSVDQFVNAVKQTVLANKRWVFIHFLILFISVIHEKVEKQIKLQI